MANSKKISELTELAVKPAGTDIFPIVDDPAGTAVTKKITYDNLGFVEVGGDTMTGQLNFSGTTHAGVKFLSLTTTERDALSPVAGMVIWNSTDSQIQGYDGSWVNLGAGAAGGESNTASNVGTAGTGIFKQKAGVDLELYKLNSTSNLLTIGLDGTDKVDLTVNSGNITAVGTIATGVWNGTAIEGSAIASTGEGGGTKFLREDGDGTCSWQAVATGNVSKVGTPVDNQVGVWTGDGTIEGTAGLTYNGSNLLLTGDIGITGTRITKGWFTDLAVTNAISGSITGNAATVSTITGLAPDTATTAAAQPNITSLGTLTTLTVDNITIDGSAITHATVADLTVTATVGNAVVIEGVSIDGGVVTGASSITSTAFAGNLTGDVTGNVSGSSGSCTGQSATVATITGLAPDTATTAAAQPNITSLGTLTTLTVDNITINGSAITHATAVDLTVTATAGNAVVIEGVSFDGGVVTGASSISSTGFSGALTGNASTATALQTARTIGGVSFDGTGNITVASATGGFAITGGALTLGTGDITGVGSLGATGARLTKGWFTDLECTNAIAGSITGNAATVTSFTPASGSLTLSGDDALTLTTTAATNVTLPTTGTLLANVSEDTTPQLGGTLDCQDNTITGAASIGFTQEFDNGSKTTDFSVDFSTDQKQKATLTANTMTLTFDTTTTKVGNYILKIVNGGLATLTWAVEGAGNFKWVGGTAPTLTSSGTDIVSMYFDGTDVYGGASLNFS